jgi:hypothetical protein
MIILIAIIISGREVSTVTEFSDSFNNNAVIGKWKYVQFCIEIIRRSFDRLSFASSIAQVCNKETVPRACVYTWSLFGRSLSQRLYTESRYIWIYGCFVWRLWNATKTTSECRVLSKLDNYKHVYRLDKS